MAVPLPYLGGLAAFILTLFEFDSMCLRNNSGRGEWVGGWISGWKSHGLELTKLMASSSVSTLVVQSTGPRARMSVGSRD